MKILVKIFWEFVYGDSFFFDRCSEWIVIILKEYNHSRLSDFKQLLKLKALARILPS